ncbi:hypothetical protein pipiens_000699, partial [Culex pipiens pipiens]
MSKMNRPQSGPLGLPRDAREPAAAAGHDRPGPDHRPDGGTVEKLHARKFRV